MILGKLLFIIFLSFLIIINSVQASFFGNFFDNIFGSDIGGYTCYKDKDDRCWDKCLDMQGSEGWYDGGCCFGDDAPLFGCFVNDNICRYQREYIGGTNEYCSDPKRPYCACYYQTGCHNGDDDFCVEHCTNYGCEYDECDKEPYRKCHNEDIWWYDPCEYKYTSIAETCDNGCDIGNTWCNSPPDNKCKGYCCPTTETCTKKSSGICNHGVCCESEYYCEKEKTCSEQGEYCYYKSDCCNDLLCCDRECKHRCETTTTQSKNECTLEWVKCKTYAGGTTKIEGKTSNCEGKYVVSCGNCETDFDHCDEDDWVANLHLSRKTIKVPSDGYIYALYDDCSTNIFCDIHPVNLGLRIKDEHGFSTDFKSCNLKCEHMGENCIYNWGAPDLVGKKIDPSTPGKKYRDNIKLESYIYYCNGGKIEVELVGNSDVIDFSDETPSERKLDSDSEEHLLWEFECKKEGFQNINLILTHPSGKTTLDTFTAECKALPLLPSYFNWKNNNGNWMTPVKDQGLCHACWAFAVVGAIEAKYKIEKKDPNLEIDLSEQELISCEGAHNGCGSGSIGFGESYVESKNGIVTEKCFPYTSGDNTVPPCSDKCDSKNEFLGVTGFDSPDGRTGSEIKQHLINKGPIMIIYDSTHGYWENDIYYIKDHEDYDHAVILVGYNDEEKYWIAKNSWGASWRDDGYFKIGYGSSFLVGSSARVYSGNPAAEYCINLGYEYKVIKDQGGKERGVCILPDGSEVSSWDFLEGEVATEYSYCAQQGYELEVRNDGMNSFSPEYAVCVGEEGKEIQEGDYMAITDLMELGRLKAIELLVEPLIKSGSSENIQFANCNSGIIILLNKENKPLDKPLVFNQDINSFTPKSTGIIKVIGVCLDPKVKIFRENIIVE